MSEYILTTDAVVKWNISGRMASLLCAEGRIDTVKIGKTWLVPADVQNPADTRKIKPNNYHGKSR